MIAGKVNKKSPLYSDTEGTKLSQDLMPWQGSYPCCGDLLLAFGLITHN